MSKKNIFFLGFLVVAFASVAKLVSVPFDGFVQPVIFPSHAISAENGWFPAAHLGTNAYLEWRIDPFLSRVALLFPTPQIALYGIMVLFHALGLTALCLFIAPTVGLRSALVAGLLASTLILQLFSLDIIVLGALVWWPWITLVLLKATRLPFNRIFPFLIILFFFGLRTTKSGNALAPFVTVFAIAVASYIGGGTARERKLTLAAGAAFTLVPLFLVTRFAMSAAFPDYPAGARVVPVEGAFGFVRTLVGPEADLPIIDRSSLTVHFGALSKLLALFVGWGWLLTRRARPGEPAIGGMLTVATVVTVSAVWDTLAPAWGEISPLRSLARLVPGLGLFPLVPLATALSLSLLVLIFTISQRVTPLVALAVILIGGSFDAGRFGWGWRTPPGSLHGVDAAVAREAQLTVASPGAGATALTAKNLLSPSAGIVLREGTDAPTARAITSHDRFVAAQPRIADVTASHNAAAVAALLDGDKKTRWSAQRGRQEGDEWIALRIRGAAPIRGIELDPGAFISDFPRALRIVAPTDCTAPLTGGRDIVVIPQWSGPIRRTEQGYLFYGAEKAVQIRFPHEERLECVLVRQTAAGRAVDWSIAELRLLEPQKDN